MHRSSAALLAAFAITIAVPAAAQSGSAEGAALFKRRCSSCHADRPGQRSAMGPNLHGVVGEKAARTAYPYSPALKKSSLRWDAATLDRWLTRPGAVVPGTRMFTTVPSAEERQKIIAYLSRSSR
ncbi:c-type cytochrome [Sphingomonas sp. PL-96]|uniref:c-type cytochrome n=1 Tax=Sphingomonas sp. PL-96 TaxID=2887201 RepID=UPI001E35674C|nr:c-type cytochrome [Sphingomonas sp. PL-96]MCC2978331.1 c-type cytochrome [Sphingomonas sp. PL-96]